MNFYSYMKAWGKMRLEKALSHSVQLTFWAKQFFVVGGFLTHCRMFSSIPGLHIL